MWQTQIDRIDNSQICKVSVSQDGQRPSYRDVIQLWQDDKAFREFFIALLADIPFAAYFWETPPVTDYTVQQGFEFVCLDTPALARLPPDPSAFADQFQALKPEQTIATFPNLGRDAILVAPRPLAPLSTYPHIAAFSRNAPGPQQHALWQAVGLALQQCLGPQPAWLSTAGMGVAWLHMRLDSSPKYYRYTPYREQP